ERLGAVGKCAPPLRPRAEVEALRSELGAIDLLASDHSPSPASMKQGDDFFVVWGGISGCQSLLPVVLTEGLPLELVTSRPAERFRLPGKGRLEPGCDADLVLVEPDSEWELTAYDLRYRHRHSPYVGPRFRGPVVGAMRRASSATAAAASSSPARAAANTARASYGATSRVGYRPASCAA